MKVTIDTKACTGHGRCYVLAPDVFDSDDVGRGVVRFTDGEVPAGLEQQAQLGHANCPEGAISCS